MAFKRCDRLNKSSMISLVSRKGASLKTPFFRIKFLPANFGGTKIAIITSKKVEKSAVGRNLIRRKISSCFQEILKSMNTIEKKKKAFLIVLFPTGELLNNKYEYKQLEKEVSVSFEKIENFNFNTKYNKKQKFKKKK